MAEAPAGSAAARAVSTALVRCGVRLSAGRLGVSPRIRANSVWLCPGSAARAFGAAGRGSARLAASARSSSGAIVPRTIVKTSVASVTALTPAPPARGRALVGVGQPAEDARLPVAAEREVPPGGGDLGDVDRGADDRAGLVGGSRDDERTARGHDRGPAEVADRLAVERLLPAAVRRDDPRLRLHGPHLQLLREQRLAEAHRGHEHEHHLRAGRTRGEPVLREAPVVADEHAEAGAERVEHDGPGAGREVVLLVDVGEVVLRDRGLAVGRDPVAVHVGALHHGPVASMRTALLYCASPASSYSPNATAVPSRRAASANRAVAGRGRAVPRTSCCRSPHRRSTGWSRARGTRRGRRPPLPPRSAR